MGKVGEKVIRSCMPDQHREFFAQLPFLLVGSVDHHAQPTASVVTGIPGFISSPGDRFIQIRANILKGDPLAKNLRLHSPLGLLGIQPHTKRRNRMNGWVIEKSEQGILIEVQQSFGNCAKYITERHLEYRSKNSYGDLQTSGFLSDRQIQLINQADTFFMATAHPQAANPENPEQGVDISHRGGKPGFVTATQTSIRFPDFSGNFFFNSFGNLKSNSAAGLIFFDFYSGDILQLEAQVNISKGDARDVELGIQFWCEAKIRQVRFFSKTLSLILV